MEASSDGFSSKPQTDLFKARLEKRRNRWMIMLVEAFRDCAGSRQRSLGQRQL